MKALPAARFRCLPQNDSTSESIAWRTLRRFAKNIEARFASPSDV
jgi:hypothetical protein